MFYDSALIDTMIFLKDTPALRSTNILTTWMIKDHEVFSYEGGASTAYSVLVIVSPANGLRRHTNRFH